MKNAGYADTVARMRDLALNQYGCLDFIAVTEGDREVAISYWQCEADILTWKADPEHQRAQELGRKRWYRD